MKKINEQQAKALLNKKVIPEYSFHWRAVGYLEAIEKAKMLEEVLGKLAKMKADYGYKSPEQQDERITSLIVNVGAWAEEALAQWEKEK